MSSGSAGDAFKSVSSVKASGPSIIADGVVSRRAPIYLSTSFLQELFWFAQSTQRKRYPVIPSAREAHERLPSTYRVVHDTRDLVRGLCTRRRGEWKRRPRIAATAATFLLFLFRSYMISVSRATWIRGPEQGSQRVRNRLAKALRYACAVLPNLISQYDLAANTSIELQTGERLERS